MSILRDVDDISCIATVENFLFTNVTAMPMKKALRGDANTARWL